VSARPHGLLLVLGIILAGWGLLLFFQGAYFAALFYGVPVPFFAAWVGQLPIWSFNVIDTVMVGVLVLAYYLDYKSRHRRGIRSARGSVGGWILLVLALFLIFAFLAYLGLNFAGLWTAFRHFWGF
jgi:hypothetical protein